MTAPLPLVDVLFRPRSIALVGASADPDKHAALPQKHLTLHGFNGRLYPINPRRDEVFGLRAYPSVTAVGEPVEHAYVMLPTEHVQRAVEDCVAAGVGCVTVMSNGYAETGVEGRERQRVLRETIRGSGTRLLGPNALGVVDLHAKVALSGNEVLSLPELRAGTVGLISQSGSMLGAILSRGQARGLGFSKLVSVGNETDISTAELIEVLADDPLTSVILLFLETIRDPERLRSAVWRAHRAGKPVLAYRLGRSSIGQQLAVSHTGAIAGSGRAVEAFLNDIGIVDLRTFEALLDAPPLFAGRRASARDLPPSTGRGLAVMTTTGGGGALVVDNLGALEVTVRSPSAAVRGSLRSEGITIDDAPLVDLTLAGTNARTYGAVMRAFLADPDTSALVCVVGSSSQFRPERAVAPIVDACAKAAGVRKPVAVFLTPNAERSRALLAGAGIPVFSQPETCADALRALLAWRTPVDPAARSAGTTTIALPRDIDGGGTLDAVRSQALFETLGITQVDERFVDADPAAWSDDTLRGVPFPCVLKLVSAEVPHKTELGAVALGVADARTLCEHAHAMRERVLARLPHATIDGFQIQAMVTALAEVLVGFTRDPNVGPVISVGLGGVLAELYQDVAVRPAPIDALEARAMLGEVRALAPLAGYRNLPRGDLDALADAVARVSSLAAEPRILEAEINPLLVLPVGQGVRAVDGLFVIGAAIGR